MAQNLLPQMCEVSRNCRLTHELHAMLQTKLNDAEWYQFMRWLQIVREEKNK
jgi:hypothetical protein